MTKKYLITFAFAVFLGNVHLAGADEVQDFQNQITPGARELEGVSGRIQAIDRERQEIGRALNAAVDKALQLVEQLRLSLGGTPLRSSEPRDDSAQVERPASMPDVPIEKSKEQLQRELRESLEFAHRKRNELVEHERFQLRVHVSSGIDTCKKYIAAGDEIGARATCGNAERKITECRTQISPALDRDAAQLTQQFKPIFDDLGDFSRSLQSNCDLMLRGIEDPALLLQKAQWRFPDPACYGHVERLRGFATNGQGDPRLGPDYATVYSYTDFIRRRCADKFLELARQAIRDGEAAKAEAERLAKENDQAQEPAALSRQGRGGSALLQRGLDQANMDEAGRPARLAKEKADEERRAAEEAKQRVQRAEEARRQAEAQRQYDRERAEQSARDRAEAFRALSAVAAEIEKRNREKAERAAAQRQLSTGGPGVSPRICVDSTGVYRRDIPGC